MTRGRPSSTQIATAYDYRRTIFLVQMLARLDSEQWCEELLSLADDWQVTHDDTLEDCLKQLAIATLQHGKDNWLNNPPAIEKED